MANEIIVRMPAFSSTMEEGEIIEWKVEVGDEVRSGQILAEVVTDKVDMELEAPQGGTVVELVAAPGTAVAVGAPIAKLESEESDLLGDLDEPSPSDESESQEAPAEPMPEPEDADKQAAGGPSHPPAPPPLRRRAKELGIDLADVKPTGKRGQITRADLDRHLAARETEPEGAEPPSTPVAERPVEQSAPAAERPAEQVSEQPAPAEVSPAKRAAVRKSTARVVTRSALIPQFVVHRRLDLTDARERKHGRSWTTEIVRALAHALRRHPDLNSSWDEEHERIVRSERVRIGVAVDRDVGLVVACVDDPDLEEPDVLDQRIRELAGRARDGKLSPEETAGATFTVSNLGGLGIDYFEALIMPPQVGIMSVGRVAEIPVVIDGWIRPRLCVDIGLTVDHRVADGADGARLLADFAEHLQGVPW